MKKKIFIAAAVIISSQLYAQQDSTKSLNEVIITATKFPIKQSQTGKVVTVISKEQIEKSSSKTVSEILNEQVGITINGAFNNAGTPQTVYMRGAASGRTLILLDGIPVSDPSMINNEFDLNFLSLNDVERIEICKGAQSTLYGSDAIAGVINIITIKNDVAKPFNFKVSKTWGNKKTSKHNIQLYGKYKNLFYNVSYSKLKTNGFSAAYDSTEKQNFDNDSYNGNVLKTLLQYQIIPCLSIKTFMQFSKYKTGIDNAPFIDDKDYTITNSTLLSGIGINYKKAKLSVTANYQFGQAKRNYLDDSISRPTNTIYTNNNYNGRTQFADLFANIAATKWLSIIAGTDYKWNLMNQQYFSVNSIWGPYSNNFKDTFISQASLYASLFFNLIDKKLNIEIGGRLNNNSKYGNNTTYTFNPSYNINTHWRLFGSIASGFKAPSIYQVYDVYSGNKNLQPEKSTNYEIGIQQTHQKMNTRLVYFNRDIKNGIDYNYTTYQYFNFVKQAVRGIELEITYRPIKNLNLTANYTLLSGTEQTQSRISFNDTTYSYLLRRPKNSLNISLGYNFSKKIFASLSSKFVSNRYDIGGYGVNDVLLNNYFIVNAYAEYKWKTTAKFFIDMQNITNKKFFDIRGYNSIPFLINVGVVLQKK